MVKGKGVSSNQNLVHVYDGAILQPLLKGVAPAHHLFGLPDTKYENVTEELAQGTDNVIPDVQKPIVSESKSCSLCSVEFQGLSDQRDHFKLDWHRYNIKQKLEGKPVITEEKFESLLEDDGGDDISISGSDESDTENDNEDEMKMIEDGLERKNRHPWCFFHNDTGQVLSIHKCLLTNTKHFSDLDDNALITRLKEVVKGQNIGVFMLGGGHFAGAIFNGKEVKVHKTFHCYTVRAKQGGSQSAADNKSGGSHPKSAGASLRRYNELSLVQHVQDIVKLWVKEIASCHVIFYRASSGNRTVLFGGKDPPLDKNDARLRSIPFATKRATFREIKRVHEVITSIKIHDSNDLSSLKGVKTDEQDNNVKKIKKKASPKKKHIRRSKSREEPHRPLPDMVQKLVDRSDSEEDDIAEDLNKQFISFTHQASLTGDLSEFGNSAVPPRSRKKKKKSPEEQIDTEDKEASNEMLNQMVTACKVGNAKFLQELLVSFQDNKEREEFLNNPISNQKTTFLHIATEAGNRNVIKQLLESGASPELKDKSKRVPYNLCPNKEIRSVFRNFQKENPDKYDYQLCQMPPPLSDEVEQRQKEKLKAKRQAKKEKEKLKKEKELEEKKEVDEKLRYLNLSDREKRALAAERRIMAQNQESGSAQPVLLRCFQCAKDITGKVPFEYEVFKFCSPKCVREHRQKGKS